MLGNVVKKSIVLDDGREISVETGKLAKQADGSVVLRMGDAMILATAVSKKEAQEGVDFMPLSVDYQEKFASAGRIPGGFLKREGRLSDHEVLVCRLVDRALRPMFPEDYHADTQINIQLISADPNVSPDALAAFAASSALAVSDIPFNGPISEVRVIRLNGEFFVNPAPDTIKEADIDLVVAATKENILMVEGEMSEVSEHEMLEALKIAHDVVIKQCELQEELAEAVGSTVKRDYSHETHDEELREDVYSANYDAVYKVFARQIKEKNKRKEALSEIKNAYLESKSEVEDLNKALVSTYFHDVEKKAARTFVLDSNSRIDGRDLDEIRPIWSEVDYLPVPHGSAVFTRGETQALCTVTLGTKLDEQIIDSAMVNGVSKFFLHYNFPGFSTGEVKPNRGPGRREVGHGNLAFRALKYVIPGEDVNPYTIRIVSDILESNGSSSMATVCGGTLALMDAGIKIKAPVSGIAMGMISDPKTGKYAVLSDILGDEDHLGDMDFKITGTSAGITACQMDIKVDGLSYEILEKALLQAKNGRFHILGEMSKTLEEPRDDMKPNAPRSVNLTIGKEMIGALIGPGGKVVQEIQKQTGTTIVIEEVDNAGKVNIFASNDEAMQKALAWVKGIVAVPDVGEVYDGLVKSIQPFGAFVEFMPGKEGLLHISEVKWERLESLDGIVEVGEEIKVKLVEVDKKTGKFRLSRKVLLPKPEGYKDSRPKRRNV